ncbi:MAG: arginase family protein, partial [Alphaproteobacteria bacterium]|nr:arginase family protein [Alphaproteobacteria bacterium]
MPTPSNITLLGVPVDCEGVPGGTARAPTILRRLGLIQALPDLKDSNDLPVEIIGTNRDPNTGIKALDDVKHVIDETHEQVTRLLKESSFPLLIGGCCTNVVGAIAAASQISNQVGLVYIDGHLDLYDGRTSQTGDFADMPMNFILGKGNASLGPKMDCWPGLAPQTVSLVGFRDREIALRDKSLMPEDLPIPPQLIDADAIHASTPSAIAEKIICYQQSVASQFWLHLDWDVLDEVDFPSSDYPMPNGLTWTQLSDLLRPLVQS